MHLTRILRHFVPVVQAVVPDDRGDTEPVVGEDDLPSGLLRGPVQFEIAPLPYGFLVPPERERKNLSGLAQAFEPLDGEKAVDAVQVRTQRARGVEVVLLPVRVGQDLENNRDHAASSPGHGATPSVPATASTKVRSSLRISRR